MGNQVDLRPAPPDCMGDRGSEVAADRDRGTAGSLRRRCRGRYAKLSLKNGATAKATRLMHDHHNCREQGLAGGKESPRFFSRLAYSGHVVD